MFEKLLQAIEKDPSLPKRQAFLALVAQAEISREKALALSQYARLVARIDPLGSLATMQYAWRLEPENPLILDEIKRLFLGLRRGEVAAKIERLKAAPAKSSMADNGLDLDLPGLLEGDALTKGSFTRNGNTVAAAPTATPTPVHEALTRTDFAHTEPAVTQSRPAPTDAGEIDFLASLDLDLNAPARSRDDTPQMEPLVVPDPPALDLNMVHTESEVRQPVEDIALTFSEVSGKKHYAVFMEFVRSTSIDFRQLEFAEGFSDSLLGLVHFVHYLRVTDKLREPNLERAVAALRQRVMSDAGDIKSQVRFLDLFDPAGGG